MSFRLKTILGIALIEVIVLGILVISSLHDLRTSNERELNTRADTTAQLLATMTSDAVVSLDLATLDALVEQTLTNRDLLYVQIKSTDGLVLSQGGRVPLEINQSSTGEPVAATDRIDATAQIKIAGTEFGSVEIGLSTSLLNAVVAAGTQRMLTIAGAEVILVAIFGFLLGTFLTRQLESLRDGAAKVATGQFGYQMPVRGKDELAHTAHSFNKMSSALADYARITKREKDEAEAGRRYAESLLHNAINSVSHAIFIVDEDTNLRFVNKAALELYGIRPAEARAGQSYTDLLLSAYAAAPSDDPAIKADAISDRMQRLSTKTVQTWQSRWNDEKVLLHTQRPIATGGFVMVDTDITELVAANEKNRRLEMELMETHKLESLGTLASGVAHEINTPTQFIGDNLKFLRESFDDLTAFVDTMEEKALTDCKEMLDDLDWDFMKDEIPAALNEAAEGVNSIGKIVLSIKEFAHPDDSETTETDMVKLIENAATVSRSQWRHSADLTVEADQDELTLPCYPGDISQVVINLIVNAADAITEYSQTQDYSGGKGMISVSVTSDTKNCIIKVRDNGPGIPVNSVRRIFDMFYTTKPPGKGTGQGLAICKSIVEIKHRGKLHVDSEVGAGSTFVVTLPLRPSVTPELENSQAA